MTDLSWGGRRRALVARLVLGELTEPIIEAIAARYKVDPALVRNVRWKFSARANQVLGPRMDLATEWVAQQVGGQQARWPEDAPRLEGAVLAFLDPEWRTPPWKGAILREHPEKAKVRSLLGWTLGEIEDVVAEVAEPTNPGQGDVDPTRLPQGARVIHQDPEWVVVEFTDPESACRAGSKTRWCTRLREDDNGNVSETVGQPATAWEYIKEGPLYVIWKEGKKFAQVHVGDDIQVMDIKDRPLDPRGPVRAALERSGLLRLIAAYYAKKSLSGMKSRRHWFTPEEDHLIEAEAVRTPEAALHYAKEVTGRRFPRGEALIAQDPETAYQYARSVLGPWPAGEPAIAADTDTAYGYVMNVLNRDREYGADPVRFPRGEPAIAREPRKAYEYAKNIIRGRWPLGEATLLRAGPQVAYAYARDVVRGPWPEGEPVIARGAEPSLEYARRILHGRFPRGEEAIAVDRPTRGEYGKFLQGIGDPTWTDWTPRGWGY
jgi:hypothetical protein